MTSFYLGWEVGGKMVMQFVYFCSFIFIGYSHLSYIRGTSIKSQKLLIYFSYFIIFCLITRWTVFDQFFFPEEELLDENKNKYHYITPYHRMSIEKYNEAIESGYMKKDTLRGDN